MPRSFEHDTVIHYCSTDTLPGFMAEIIPRVWNRLTATTQIYRG
jgi:hypothetical protein